MPQTLVCQMLWETIKSLSADLDKEPNVPGTVYNLVSTDSKYTPTSATKHNYRYRAIFSQDYYNEVPGSLSIEKIQRPDSMGSPFKVVWTKRINLSGLESTKQAYKKLHFESALGCCNYSEVLWKDYVLHFNVKVGKNLFKCHTTDVRKGQPKITCNQ